jgi:CRP-like cAMP-binding protein
MNASHLRSIPLFADLTDHQLSRISRVADEVDLPPGKRLVQEGQFSYEFFVIEEGSADVIRDGRPIAALGPGDFLGEMGIIGRVVRNATVVMTSSGRVIAMTEQAFRSMARANPDVADRIAAAVEERCQALTG